MEDVAKLASFAILGDADPVPPSFLAAYPEQAKTLTLLYDVSRELTSILDRQELLRRIAERVKKIVDYDVFSVMLWNESTQLLESVFGMRYEDSIPTCMTLPLRSGLTGAAASQRRPVRVDDVLADGRYIQCETGLVIRSELVIPLFLQERLIGVLDLENLEPNAFTAENERMLATLGSFIAVALENARLYEEIRDNENRLQEDLTTAREIQRQLLPHGARGVPGLDLAAAYLPARALGGDFYDFLPYGQGKLAIALGDVSGKGTAAALYGSLAIGTLRELVVSCTCNPASMLQMLNQRMHGARLDSRFIAMLFAVYDGASRKLTLSNAGSPYPLLVRGGKTEEIRVEGMPLGLFPTADYQETTIELQPDDVVIFASDGILESENAKQEEFGSKRLHAVLADRAHRASADELADRIITATNSYIADACPHDDRTLLVLRVSRDAEADHPKLPVIY